ncbi:hypothetical protein R3P38DRAFT_3311137 [Favolaschia claudopus]|uniref:Uncharacterized protein n=1 Tax=Favolaschia claudopus TaxID=2862362 RepID=A0AAW0CMC2_9AGAR
MASHFTTVPTARPVRLAQRHPSIVVLSLLQTPFPRPRYPPPLAFTRFPLRSAKKARFARRAEAGPSSPPSTPSRTKTPPRAPTPPAPPASPRAPSPRNRSPPRVPPRQSTPVPDSPLTEPEEEEMDYSIKRPSNATIADVKAVFRSTYPELDAQAQETEYDGFRAKLAQLIPTHLNPSLALAFQETDALQALEKAMLKDYPWLDRCVKLWPVSVCLQSKLHNSAARTVVKSQRKVIAMVQGNAPPKTRVAKTNT